MSAPLRLHLNENTAGCSPAVLSALRTLGREALATYPDYQAATQCCERWLGVPAGWVQLTNGLDEGIHVVAQAAARRRQQPSVVILEPAFEVYAACADAAGLDVAAIPYGVDFSFPIERVLDGVTSTTSLVYLNDPHNPSGAAIPAGAIERIAAAASHAIVLVDEAYADFSGRTCIGLIARHPNVVVGRTFAKAHGLAGLRIGALVGAPATLTPIRKMLPPFSVNVCAAAALEAALRDRSYLDWYVSEVTSSKALIYSVARRLGLTCWPSDANFVLVRVGPSAAGIAAEMAARGVLVRDRSGLPRCDGCIRITAGVVSATRRGLEMLEDTLATRPR